MVTLDAEQVFPCPRKDIRLDDLTVADVFVLTLEKLPADTRLSLVYGVPKTLNRDGLSPQQVIEILTPIFRGKVPQQTVRAGYRAYPSREGALHFIDLILNPESCACGVPITEGPRPYARVSIFYDAALNGVDAQR